MPDRGRLRYRATVHLKGRLLGVLASLSVIAAMGVGIWAVQPQAVDADATLSSARASQSPSPSPTPTPTPTAEPLPVLRAAAPVTLEARPEPKKTRKPKPTETPTVAAAPALPSAEFVISSFNVLGSSHTRPGGNKPGMASGTTRMQWAVQLVERHGVDVVGFQELEEDQLHTFNRLAGGRFGIYPGMQLGKPETRNSLAWRTSTWQLLEAQYIDIPYFDGNLRKMPVVLLQHRATGRQAWFANFHNPASTKRVGNQQHWRNVATAKEIDLANRLRASGNPVFFTGDMNEKASYFCALTGRAPMIAANGGSNSGGCRPPGNMKIDWIFGSNDASFTGYFADRSAMVQKTSDHAMIVSRAVLAGQ